MQKQQSRSTPSSQEQVDDVAVSQEFKDRNDDLKSSIDDILDDIDAVLEENASTFVKSYIQAPGE